MGDLTCRSPIFWLSGKILGDWNKNIKNSLLAMPVLRTCR